MKRKLSLLFVVLALAICSNANAQIKFGAKVGLNMASAGMLDLGNLSNNLNADNYNGLMVGPTMEVSLFGMGFDASLLYSQKGIAIKDFGSASVSYLELPINIKYKIGIPKLVGVYATAGPYFSYAFSDNLSSSVIKSIDKNKIEVGGSVGAGVELFSKVQVGAVYSIGFGKNTVELVSLGTVDYRNGVLSLTATYFF